MAALVFPQAAASPFPHQYIDAAAGRLTLGDTRAVAGETDRDLVASVFEGAYRTDAGLVLKGRSAFAVDEAAGTRLELTTLFLGAAVPLAALDRVALVPELGYRAAGTRTCDRDTCADAREDGLGYGLGMRAWALPGRLELSAGWNGSTVDDEEPRVGVGGAFWWLDAHSIRLEASRRDESTLTTIGYRYTWR